MAEKEETGADVRTEERITYTLRMDPRQAATCLNAVELLMRLKINQPEEISMAVLDAMYTEIGCDEYCRRRDRANELLRKAFDVIFPRIDEVRKDTEWHVLYNLYQAIRYQIHLAEYPNSTGVDSDPPRDIGGVGIPQCSYFKEVKLCDSDAEYDKT